MSCARAKGHRDKVRDDANAHKTPAASGNEKVNYLYEPQRLYRKGDRDDTARIRVPATARFARTKKGPETN